MARKKEGREDGRSLDRRSLVWTAALAVFLIAPLVLTLYLRNLTRFDAPQEFWDQKGELVDVTVQPAEGDSVYRAYEVRLTSSAGYRVSGFLRAPRESGRWPALVLLGGIRTGKMSASLVTPHSPYVILGLDYPWEGPTRLSAWQFLRNVFKVREAMLLTPSAVFLALDYLETRDDVDPDRLTLAGASFGAQLMTVAGALDPRVGPVVICYGGGDYELLLRGAMKLEPKLLRFPLALAGAWLVDPLEPLDYVADIAPDPVVIINGLKDDRIPPQSVYLLYGQAGHPKRLVWLDEGHVSSRNTQLLQRVLDAAVDALDQIQGQGTETVDD